MVVLEMGGGEFELLGLGRVETGRHRRLARGGTENALDEDVLGVVDDKRRAVLAIDV